MGQGEGDQCGSSLSTDKRGGHKQGAAPEAVSTREHRVASVWWAGGVQALKFGEG